MHVTNRVTLQETTKYMKFTNFDNVISQLNFTIILSLKLNYKWFKNK